MKTSKTLSAALLLLFCCIGALAQSTNLPGQFPLTGTTTGNPNYALVSAWTNVLYVNATTGNDTTYRTNDANYPRKTIPTNAPRGFCVYVERGTYNVTNAITVPYDGAIIGDGTNYTIVNSYVAPLGTAGPTFALSTNCYLADLTIDLKYRGTTTNASRPTFNDLYQAGYGSHKATGNKGYTNAIAANLYVLGETDCFFNRNTNRGTMRAFSCVHTSKWDTVAFMEAAHEFDFINCQFWTQGPNNIAGATGRGNCFAVDTATDCRLRVFGGHCYASNNVTPNQSLILSASSSGASIFEFHNISGTNWGTGDFSGGGSGILVLNGGTWASEKLSGIDWGSIIASNNWTSATIGGATITMGVGIPSASAPNGSIYHRTDAPLRYQRLNGAWVVR